MIFSEFEGRGLRTRMRGKIQGHKNSERMRRAAVAETHLQYLPGNPIHTPHVTHWRAALSS